jgi:lipid-binding SYLF domain-containing protein
LNVLAAEVARAVHKASTMHKARSVLLLGTLLCTVALASDADLIQDARATLETFRKTDANLERFIKSASGWAVFPTIDKGGFIVGGAGGTGVLFEGGKPIGKTSMGQATIGFQLGGQAYSEIIFFENASSLNEFKHGNFALAAQASAVALSAGAAATAKYENGIAIFTMTKTGLMYEASVGGQKFGYTPFSR